jgi:hypothetical protein
LIKALVQDAAGIEMVVADDNPTLPKWDGCLFTPITARGIVKEILFVAQHKKIVAYSPTR